MADQKLCLRPSQPALSCSRHWTAPLNLVPHLAWPKPCSVKVRLAILGISVPGPSIFTGEKIGTACGLGYGLWASEYEKKSLTGPSFSFRIPKGCLSNGELFLPTLTSE